MANSRDTRKHTRWQRGARRYDDVGGHSPVGDELENTRDHERIWFELRRHRSCCCDPETAGFRFCSPPRSDYPTIVCNEFQLEAGSLIDYFPGDGGNDGSSWFLNAGCGSTKEAHSEPFASATFFPDGSWRNGPFLTGMARQGLFLQTGDEMSGNFWLPNRTWTFEFWIKPSPTDILNEKNLVSSGPFMTLSDGGLFVAFTVGGGATVEHETFGTALSKDGIFTADEWAHVVLVRDAEAESISLYVNGVRRVFHTLANDFPITNDIQLAYGLAGNSQWSDLARYAVAVPASVIFRHYRSLADDYGLTPPDGDEPAGEPGGGGTVVDNPADYIFDLSPDRIDGEDSKGSILTSNGDTGYWQTPEESPFELEERKDQPDGYAGLDSDGLVASGELGRAPLDSDPDPEFVLTKDNADSRIWRPGQPVPKPTALGQMVRADPSTSDVYTAILDTNFTPVRHWPLTEAAAPFGGGGIGLVAAGSGGPDVVTDASGEDLPFEGESFVEFSDTDGLNATSTLLFDAGRAIIALWLRVTELPAATVRIVRYQNLQLNLRSDGKLELAWAGTPFCTSVSAVTVGEWVHVVGANDGNGTLTGSAIWINGVRDVTAGGNFGGGFATLQIAGDGLHAQVAHVSVSEKDWVDLVTDAEMLSLFEARRPVWTLTTEVSGSGGVSASEDDVPVTAAPRSRVNFKAGANVALDVVDDEAGDEVEVTIAATSPAGSGIEASEGGVDVTASPRGRLDFVAGSGVTVEVTDDAANDKAVVTVSAEGATGGIEVSKDGADVTAAPRGRVNLIAGTGVALSVVDDAVNDEVDVTIAVTGGGGGGSSELDYVEITADVNITAVLEASADVVITSGAVVLDGSTAVKVEFFCPGYEQTQDQGTKLVLFDAVDGGAAAPIGTLDHPRVAASGSTGGTRYEALYSFCRLTPASGSHVFSVRAYFSDGSGTATVKAGAGGAGAYLPASLTVTAV